MAKQQAPTDPGDLDALHAAFFEAHQEYEAARDKRRDAAKARDAAQALADAHALLDAMPDAELQALAQAISTKGITPTSKVGTPGSVGK